MNERVLGYITEHQAAFLEELKGYLRFASVSADSRFRDQTLQCAQHTADLMCDAGLTEVQIFETDGFPVVYGELMSDPSRPTVLIYGHYDVQPPDPLDLWVSGPFEPEVRDGYLFARGVSDDKGQIFCHLKAIQAWLKTTGTLPVNVKVIIEGEEEVGSPNLLPFLEKHTDLLKADLALVSDTPMLGKGQPSICTSLRGLVYVEVTAKGVGGDLHSGQHGGAVPNAITGLVSVLSRLKDENGHVTIPGFYEDVQVLSAAQRQAVAALTHSDTEYMASIGATALTGETGYSTLERRWYRPTLDINGIWGGYMGEGSKTVIPNLAHAKFSMRLVANQNPLQILEALRAYLPTLAPAGITLTLSTHTEAAFPAAVDPSHYAVKAGLKALEQAFGVPAVLQGEGGTIPVIADFKRVLGLPTVLMGFNLPDDNIHAPNERFLLANFFGGIEASAYFLNGLHPTPNPSPFPMGIERGA